MILAIPLHQNQSESYMYLVNVFNTLQSEIHALSMIGKRNKLMRDITPEDEEKAERLIDYSQQPSVFGLKKLARVFSHSNGEKFKSAAKNLKKLSNKSIFNMGI